jgi:hypothetical protein
MRTWRIVASVNACFCVMSLLGPQPSAGGPETEGQAASASTSVLIGPYLGQKPPGTTPEVFAPGIVSTRADEYGLEVSVDGNEIIFVRGGAIMLTAREPDGPWELPAVAPFSGEHIDGEPCFTPDGRRIVFSSRRPQPNAKRARNIWVSEKKGGVWETAVPFDALPWDKTVHALSIAASGNVYEDGVIRFRFLHGRYGPAEHLSPPVKGMYPFIAPDESYIVISDCPPGRWDADLFVSFREREGAWAQPVSLGGAINSQDREGNSFVTSDGRFLFFSRKQDIYWVSAKVIEELRLKGAQGVR